MIQIQEMHKCDFCPYETETCKKLVYDRGTECIEPNSDNTID